MYNMHTIDICIHKIETQIETQTDRNTDRDTDRHKTYIHLYA